MDELERLGLAAWGLRYFLTADLCAQTVVQAMGKGLIKQQHEAAEISGVVDQRVLYKAGMLAHVAAQALKETKELFKKYKVKPLPLALVADLAECIAEPSECKVPEQYELRDSVIEDIRAGTLKADVTAAASQLTREEGEEVLARIKQRADELDIPGNK